jgi:hypothetical protein
MTVKLNSLHLIQPEIKPLEVTQQKGDPMQGVWGRSFWLLNMQDNLEQKCLDTNRTIRKLAKKSTYWGKGEARV